MIIFAIPLRSAKSTTTWETCELSFNHTIDSIFNQLDCDDFKCIVACNEIPTLYKKYDERLEFIPMNLPVPKEWLEMARDKFWKLTRIAVRCREILSEQTDPNKGIYIMPLDADDLVSNQIAAYCAGHPDENGFVSKAGYVWYQSEKKLHIYNEMNKFCGSCNVIKMYLEDLPENMPYDDRYCHDKNVAGELNSRYPIRFDHNEVVDIYEKNGRPFSYLPFYSTIYMLGNGNNISALYHSQYDAVDKRFHPVAAIRKILEVSKWRPISKTIKKEFGISWI